MVVAGGESQGDHEGSEEVEAGPGQNHYVVRVAVEHYQGRRNPYSWNTNQYNQTFFKI